MAVPTFKERMEKNPRFNWYQSDFDFEVWIDPTLAHNLLCLIESAKTGNGDLVIVVDGEEGCQPAGSKVLLSNGEYKNIEEVKVGDKVLSPQLDGTNTYETVTDTCAWDCKETYSVQNLNKNNTELYRCSNNHLIPINTRKIPRNNGKREFKNNYWTIENRRADSYSKLSKFVKQNRTTITMPLIENYEGRSNPSVNPYTLGVFLGDGFSDKYSNHLDITSNDPVVISKVSRYVDILSITEKKGTTCKRYNISRYQDFFNYLEESGLKGKYSGEKYIPKECLVANSNFRIELLAGLIDTDGTLGRNESYSITTKSEQLAKDIQDLVYSLGGRANIIPIKKQIKSRNFEGSYYTVSLYLSIQLPTVVERKTKKPNRFYLSSNRTSIDVKPGGAAKVYGISLTGNSKLYITDNYCVTHNTGKSTLGRQIGRLLDPTFTERRIEFSPEAAKEAHFLGLPSLESRQFIPELYRQGKYDGKPWEVVMLDESAKLDRKRTMASSSVDFMGFISQSRQLHKIFIMILPNVHMLDGYIAEHRTVALIHCEKEKRTNRRIYKWYGRKHLKEMFKTDMHKRKMYPRSASFSGTFTSKNPFDLTVYEQKKAAALEAYRKKESGDGDPALVGADKEEIVRIIEESAMVVCLKNPKIHQVCVYKALNIHYSRWKELRQRCKKKYNLNPEPTIGPVKRLNDKKGFLQDLIKGSKQDAENVSNIDEYSVEEDDLE